MYATLIRQGVGESLLKFLPKPLPPTHIVSQDSNLYQILSRTPYPKGVVVHQTRWHKNNIPDSYWKITRARFKCEGKHGKAWGILYWKGRQINSQPQLIRGGLKYAWRQGRSS